MAQPITSVPVLWPFRSQRWIGCRDISSRRAGRGCASTEDYSGHWPHHSGGDQRLGPSGAELHERTRLRRLARAQCSDPPAASRGLAKPPKWASAHYASRSGRASMHRSIGRHRLCPRTAMRPGIRAAPPFRWLIGEISSMMRTSTDLVEVARHRGFAFRAADFPGWS
jgi:hypothetical protein